MLVTYASNPAFTPKQPILYFLPGLKFSTIQSYPVSRCGSALSFLILLLS